MNANATPVLKKVRYYEGRGAADAYVEYIIMNGECIFTGVTPGTRSTINGAEEIILAIAKQENIFPNQLKWFDLQVKKGHPASFKPGGLDYDEITFNFDGKAITDVSWERTECPEVVQHIFAEHIAGS